MARPGRPPRNPIDLSDDEIFAEAQPLPLGDRGHDIGDRDHDEGQRTHTDIDEWLALYTPAVNVNEFPKIPANPGMSQRWIRVRWKAGGEVDEKNSTNRYLQAWRPQRVNKSLLQFQSLMGASSEYGDHYVYKEHILMERPAQLNKMSRKRQLADTEARKNMEPQEFTDAQGLDTSDAAVWGLRAKTQMHRTAARRRGPVDDF